MSPKNRHQPPNEPGGYTPPASPEAKQSVLGAILVRPNVLDAVADVLKPDDFYRQAHGQIFQAMLDLYAYNQPVDLVTVTALLRERNLLEAIGGPVFLAQLSEQVGFATNADYYAGLVRDKAILRRLLDATQAVAGARAARIFRNPKPKNREQEISGISRG
jgi:replicative DNA helicase